MDKKLFGCRKCDLLSVFLSPALFEDAFGGTGTPRWEPVAPVKKTKLYQYIKNKTNKQSCKMKLNQTILACALWRGFYKVQRSGASDDSLTFIIFIPDQEVSPSCTESSCLPKVMFYYTTKHHLHSQHLTQFKGQNLIKESHLPQFHTDILGRQWKTQIQFEGKSREFNTILRFPLKFK